MQGQRARISLDAAPAPGARPCPHPQPGRSMNEFPILIVSVPVSQSPAQQVIQDVQRPRGQPDLFKAPRCRPQLRIRRLTQLRLLLCLSQRDLLADRIFHDPRRSPSRTAVTAA